MGAINKLYPLLYKGKKVAKELWKRITKKQAGIIWWHQNVTDVYPGIEEVRRISENLFPAALIPTHQRGRRYSMVWKMPG